MSTPVFRPFLEHVEYPIDEMVRRSQAFYSDLRRRRTIREFSSRPVPKTIIEQCLLAAGSSPSGANLQLWHFVIISRPDIKKQIREAAEEEEHEFYNRRAPKEWLEVLEPLGTNENKPFLETAPYLIAIFVQTYGLLPRGRRIKHYYAVESVGIATGVLITALHHAGLATLTHTPSPMRFLNSILDRPKNERPFLLLVTGYPDEQASVPVINKKTLQEIATFI